MCQFKSGIVLPDKIVVPLDKDSHTNILKSLGIKDDSEFPNFVRIEYVPKDGDIFNHDPDNWVLKVNQDFRPDWFDAEKAARLMREFYMPQVFEKSFIIDRTVEEITTGRWFMKNGIIQKLSGDAVIEQMKGSAQVGEMRESAQVRTMRGSATARKFYRNKKAQIFVPKGAFEIVEVENSNDK